jgi:hypothetical protein
MPNRPGRTREVAYMLTPEVERAMVRVLHEVEAERGRRVTWDHAFRRLLEMAGRRVEEAPSE